MATADIRRIDLVEVAPRDGLQSIAEPVSTEEKIALIAGLLDAGVRRMEIGSFVSPKAVPQMADMREVVAGLGERWTDGLAVLIPNAKGAEIAVEAGCRALVFVLSVSETHNLRNVRRTVGESLDQLRAIAAVMARTPGIALRVDLATAFDCPFDGSVPEARVREVFEATRSIVPRAEFALCDTTGRADPFRVRALFAGLIAADPTVRWAFHGHDTFGMGVANAFAAYDAGVRVIDGSTAGLGGCPFAPGASGNTATEDLVYAFARGGIETGIDMTRLLAVSDRIAALPGGRTGGHLRTVPRDRVTLVR
ncbi:hydroxymethylglutaryl-CoA lyase [Marivibrio halodurans]|uniref:Hydroxymethylglutaryl-CoA lyase n=1 Tax=Marivibrio halodurans TaxID=2039722 RepID=A0A8J7V3U7_9PROT|nr:hydroxymethylglutaryl-CoA lyase [Marivibrio halodurans]MBP5858372.1 hydroxymethylglutaryl-CoA lyase [Marivibrio halodurans]